MQQVLPRLISLLQYADASDPPAYGLLDSRVTDLFNAETVIRITKGLFQGRPWIFFSRWQLLFAIKLISIFSSRNVSNLPVTDDQFLKLLLMTNDFYPQGESAHDTSEGLIENLQRTTLRGYSVTESEKPWMLIGRYAEIFGRLAAKHNQADFYNWMDIHKVLSCEMGIRLDTFKAVLFGLRAGSENNLPRERREMGSSATRWSDAL